MRALLASPLGFAHRSSRSGRSGAAARSSRCRRWSTWRGRSQRPPRRPRCSSSAGRPRRPRGPRPRRAGARRPGTVVGLTGIGGSLPGSALNRNLDGDLLLAGVRPARPRRSLAHDHRLPQLHPRRRGTGAHRHRAARRGGAPFRRPGRPSGRPRRGRRSPAGTAVGFLTGLFGVGGGFVIVPALTLVLGFTMPARRRHVPARHRHQRRHGPRRPPRHHRRRVVRRPALHPRRPRGVATGTGLASRIDAGALVRWFAASLVALSLYITASSLVSLTT